MSAAAELVAFKDDPLAQAGLSASARSDPFWAVRRGAIDALAKTAGAQGPAIMKKAALDAHPSVRTAALVALGDLKDRSLLAFFKERFAADGSDGVRAESLRAIGKLGDRTAVPFLEQCAAVPSYRNLIATAAKQAIAMVETREKTEPSGASM
jgi:aminopeptidase N